jgi:hypothetical protein
MTAPSCPHVYRAIHAVTAAFARDGIAKTRFNLRDQYQYRSIDDVLNRLGPLLAKHRLCVLPRVLKHRSIGQVGEQDSPLTSVRVLVAFDMVSTRDGSSHSIQSWGEALDPGDNATAKAMSAAYKAAMLQAFCIPVASDDPEASSYRIKAREVEPVEGWQAWSDGILDMIRSCESAEALDRVRTRHAGPLAALKRERPELYARIGEGFTNRGQELITPRSAAKCKAKASKVRRKPLEPVDA